MKERLRMFMLGRYGNDDLNRLISIVAFLLLLVSVFVASVILDPIVMVLILLCLFRMFSKNTARRSKENYAYLQLRGKIAKPFVTRWKHFKQRKTHRFYKCPSCHVWVRVPKGKGRIAITCTRCKASFEKKT